MLPVIYFVILDLVLTSFAAVTYSPSLTRQLRLADTLFSDRFQLLPTSSHFVFDFNNAQLNGSHGGNIVAANRKSFPALVGTNSGMAVGHLTPCGINTIHTHPRSAELQVVVEGRLIAEMTLDSDIVDRDGNKRVIRNYLERLQMTPFYQGALHTQFNPDCSNATFVASFASEDFGTEQLANGILGFSNDIVAASLGHIIAGKDIDLVRHSLPPGITQGVEQCLKKCGIEKRATRE